MRESRRLGGIGCLICLSLGRWHGEQLACLRDVVGAGAIGEQTVVTNAMEAGGQHMDEEATDELIGCERHCFVPIASFDSIVFPLESDALVVERDQSDPELQRRIAQPREDAIVQLIAAQIRGMGEIGHARRLRFRCVWQVPARR